MKQISIRGDALSTLDSGVPPFCSGSQDIPLWLRFSPNKKYLITWGEHAYYVLDAFSGRLLSKSNRCTQLFDAYIADNGFFILEDWLSPNSLSCKISIKFLDGEVVFSKRYPLNVFSVSLSEQGHFATVQLCHGENKYSNALFLINLLEKTPIVSQIDPITGWANAYTFDTDKNEIILEYSNNCSYRYSFNGNFLDSEKLRIEEENSAQGTEAFNLAKKYVKRMNSTNIMDYQNVLSLIERALKPYEMLSDATKASIYRLLGDVQLRCNNIGVAIQSYKNALKLNDKVGVKKLLKRLEQK